MTAAARELPAPPPDALRVARAARPVLSVTALSSSFACCSRLMAAFSFISRAPRLGRPLLTKPRAALPTARSECSL